MAPFTYSMRSRVVALPALALALASCGGSDDKSADSSGLIDWPDDRSTGAAIGDTAPNFKLATSDGSEVVLADSVANGPVVVNFLATWCANCMEEMDILVTLASEGHSVIGVNLRESAETVAKLATDTGATFPILLDESGRVTREYKVLNLPATAIINTDGTITSFTRGPIELDAMREALGATGG